MDRRRFIGSMAGSLLAAPLATKAQNPDKVYRIGELSAAGSSVTTIEPFEEGLRDLGYVEGRNIVIERRLSRGDPDELAAFAADLVRLRVEVIAALDPPATAAAKRATRTVPIVMRFSNDPVEEGLVASLPRPGGNLTGLYSLYEQLTPKRLELLIEAMPGIKQVAVLWDPARHAAIRVWREAQRAAKSLGVEISSLGVGERNDFEPAFRTIAASRARAILTLRNPHIVRKLAEIVHLAARYRIPAMYDERTFVDAGGLMSYGASLADLHRRAAGFVDKILRGAKPADLPVEQPTKFELVINMKTAQALGLKIPQPLLLRADEVIQ